MAGHGLPLMHAGGEGGDQDLSLKSGVVTAEYMRRIVRGGEDFIQPVGLARKRIAVVLEMVPKCLSQTAVGAIPEVFVTSGQARVGRPVAIG
jgi:hypothetical protein